MTRAEKARRIQRILNRLYPDAGAPLDHGDQVTPQLFARAATPEQMLELSVPEIRRIDVLVLSHADADHVSRIIRSCGLAPSKAKAIRGLSRLLVDEHGGRVPADFDALEALPGVGHKTASVVMVQAFGHPAFPVDTHIRRLAGRWGLSRARNVVETERDLKRLFAAEDWGKIHLQIIYFGRQHCPARRHDLAACPICGWAATQARRALEAKRTR